MEQAAKFAETTQILMNVSEFTDVSQATDTLISAVQAFGYTAETSMDVVDLLNTIGNNYAISTADLAKSLTKSSASLVAAGGNLAEAAALTATANAIIQDADSVGTALKTTSLRLRGTSVKVLEEEGLDSDGAIESTSKLRSQVLATSGVDILTDSGAYKSTYQILLEIAEVWDQITDDKARAGLLELLAGKRNSSVIAALLQNPEELKAAYEDANNAAGSALKENEKYLDSIQGRIDLFNNSVQAMWQNTLDSDVVKWFVNVGTALVKIIDKLGLVRTALAGLAIGAMIKGKTGPIGLLTDLMKLTVDVSDKMKNLGSSIKSVFSGDMSPLTKSLTDFIKAQQASQASTLATKLNMQGLTKEQLLNQISTSRLSGELVGLNTNQMLNAMQTTNLTGEQKLAAISTLGLTDATKAVSREQLISALTTQGVAEADAVAIAGSVGLTGANVGLAASFKALWTAMWPVLVVMLAIGAVVAIVKLFDAITTTSSELRESLSDLKTEISDVKSEIESLNSELETTQDRMAELLAKDSLTFTEQEELESLQKQNDELEREIYLLEQREKRLQDQAQDTFDKLMGKKKNLGRTRDKDGDGEEEVYNRKFENKFGRYQAWTQELELAKQALVEAEKNEDKKAIKKAQNRVDKAQKKVNKFKGEAYTQLNQLVEDADGIDYASADSGTRKYLDYIYNAEGRMNIFGGDDQAKSMEIKRIFNKDALSSAKAEIDELVKQLAKDPNNDSIITQISEQCELAEDDLAAVELKVQDAVNYFTQLGANASFDTFEGKIAEVGRAATNFEALLKGDKFNIDGVDIGLADLFDKEGKIIQTTLSQIFNNTSEQTRKDITAILEGSYDQIKDGLNDGEITNLLTNAGIRFSRAILEIEKSNMANTNLELFPGLKDEISGIIDTFDELTSSIGSVVDAMDALDQARAEEAYSGSVSLETLEKLMQSTDNYADLIEVDETGAIKLATNAQDILVQQKLNAIKANADLALKDAELALQEAIHAEQTYTQTGPAQDFLRKMTMEVGGAITFVSSLWNDLISGNWSGAWERAKSAQQASLSSSKSEYAAEAAEASVLVAEAQKRVEDAEKMKKIADGLTSENVKERYDSDTASGGTDNPEDAEKKKAEDGWEAIANKYENKLALITNERNLIEAEIDKMEARGGKASAQYYRDLIDNSNEEKELLQEKYNVLEAYLNYSENAIDPDTWTEYNNKLNEIAVAIKECETNTIEWAEAIREIDIHYFEQTTEAISQLGEELDFVNSLLEDEEVADENGNWSSAALTRIGLYTQQMEKAAAEAKLYQDEIDKLNTQYEDGELSEEQYQERLSELVSGQRDAINSYEDAKDGIVELNEARIDAIKNGIEREIQAYEDYIDTVKNALDAERD